MNEMIENTPEQWIYPLSENIQPVLQEEKPKPLLPVDLDFKVFSLPEEEELELLEKVED